MSEEIDLDDVRANVTEFYRQCVEDHLAPLVAAGEISQETAAAAVKKVLSIAGVRDLIESAVQRLAGVLH